MTTQYETVAGTPAEPEVQHEARTLHRISPPELYMMTEIGDGVFVQWSACDKCSKRVGTDPDESCTCTNGPQEPDYIKRWRTQRFAKSFAERGIDPRADAYSIKRLMKTVQEAQDTSYGDSNDEEIDTLRDALSEALGLLGLTLPDPTDDLTAVLDDPTDDDPMHSIGNPACAATHGGECPLPGHNDSTPADEDDTADPDAEPEVEEEASDDENAREHKEAVLDQTSETVDDALAAGLAALKAEKENSDVGF